MEVLIFNDYFLSISALALLVVLIFQFINDKILKYKMNDTLTQATTWGLSILLAVFGWWQGIGIFEVQTLLMTIAYGLATGALANKIFTLDVIQSLLGVFKLLANKPKK